MRGKSVAIRSPLLGGLRLFTGAHGARHYVVCDRSIVAFGDVIDEHGAYPGAAERERRRHEAAMPSEASTALIFLLCATGLITAWLVEAEHWWSVLLWALLLAVLALGDLILVLVLILHIVEERSLRERWEEASSRESVAYVVQGGPLALYCELLAPALAGQGALTPVGISAEEGLWALVLWYRGSTSPRAALVILAVIRIVAGGAQQVRSGGVL